MVARAIPMIMTRPRGSNKPFVKHLTANTRRQIEVIESPLIEIVPTKTSVNLDGAVSAIFTSSNGVRFAPEGQGRNAYCVGQATSAAASQSGWTAKCMGEDADGLVAAFLRDAPEEPFVHLRGVHARGAVAQRLNVAGLNVREITVYDQRLLPLTHLAKELLAGGTKTIVPVFSPRSAQHFRDECPDDSDVHVVALSAQIAEVFAGSGDVSVDIAQKPTRECMVSAIEKLIERVRLG